MEASNKKVQFLYASEKPGAQEIVEADVSDKFMSELDFLD